MRLITTCCAGLAAVNAFNVNTALNDAASQIVTQIDDNTYRVAIEEVGAAVCTVNSNTDFDCKGKVLDVDVEVKLLADLENQKTIHFRRSIRGNTGNDFGSRLNALSQYVPDAFHNVDYADVTELKVDWLKKPTATFEAKGVFDNKPYRIYEKGTITKNNEKKNKHNFAGNFECNIQGINHLPDNWNVFGYVDMDLAIQLDGFYTLQCQKSVLHKKCKAKYTSSGTFNGQSASEDFLYHHKGSKTILSWTQGGAMVPVFGSKHQLIWKNVNNGQFYTLKWKDTDGKMIAKVNKKPVISRNAQMVLFTVPGPATHPKIVAEAKKYVQPFVEYATSNDRHIADFEYTNIAHYKNLANVIVWSDKWLSTFRTEFDCSDLAKSTGFESEMAALVFGFQGTVQQELHRACLKVNVAALKIIHTHINPAINTGRTYVHDLTGLAPAGKTNYTMWATANNIIVA